MSAPYVPNPVFFRHPPTHDCSSSHIHAAQRLAALVDGPARTTETQHALPSGLLCQLLLPQTLQFPAVTPEIGV